MQAPADRVIDVQFSAFMADPFGTVRTIYDRLGRQLDAATERRMRDFLAAHPGDPGGHRYTFADTRLDAGELRERVRSYQDYFAVPSERVD